MGGCLHCNQHSSSEESHGLPMHFGHDAGIERANGDESERFLNCKHSQKTSHSSFPLGTIVIGPLVCQPRGAESSLSRTMTHFSQLETGMV